MTLYEARGVTRARCDRWGCRKNTARESERFEYDWALSGGTYEIYEFCGGQHQREFESLNPTWATSEYRLNARPA